MDETAIYFSLMPEKTLTLKDKTCAWGLKSKEWPTKLLCCNANSTDKLKLLITGKYATPRCFKNVGTFPC
jgi:hypothetical protein